MKRLITIPIIAMLMAYVIFPSHAMAANKSSYTICMQKSSKEQTSHNKRLDNEGRRSSPAPIYCILSETSGIEIIGLSEKIISYEIWDLTSEINLASFTGEAEFLDYLFSITGTFLIKFETENYSFIGDILLR